MRFTINPITDEFDIVGLGSGVFDETLTGNSGGPVAPDGSGNINVLGDNASGLNTVGNGSPNTLTIFGLASTTTQIGTTRYATNAEAAAQTIGNAALTPSNITSMFSVNPLPATQGGTGRISPAAHSLLITNGSSAFTILGTAGNGQIPIGSLGSDPVLANITSSDLSITITNGPGTIDLSVAAGTHVVETLTGDSGGAISPTAGNINTLGTGSITIAGSGSTLTTQLTGLTNHSLLVGAGTATITNLGVATNGQLPIGSTGADPVLATLTAGTGISITNGAGTISIATNGASTVNTLTGNTGGAISPTGGNINTLGTGSITVAGSGSTLTTQLTGLTNHNVLIGAGTATITNVSPSATSGVPLISQGAAADPTFGTAVVAGGGTGSVSFNINGAIYSNTTTTGVLQAATLTSGQLLIGGTTTPAAATLTAGTGISITNGNNSITINSSGGGITWVNVTGTTQTVATGNGYLSNNAGTITFTLPASSTIGDYFRIAGVQGLWTIAQNAGQQILYGNMSTTVGVTGSITSTNAGDCMEFVATNTSASSVWRVITSLGNFTVA